MGHILSYAILLVKILHICHKIKYYKPKTKFCFHLNNVHQSRHLHSSFNTKHSYVHATYETPHVRMLSASRTMLHSQIIAQEFFGNILCLRISQTTLTTCIFNRSIQSSIQHASQLINCKGLFRDVAFESVRIPTIVRCPNVNGTCFFEKTCNIVRMSYGNVWFFWS